MSLDSNSSVKVVTVYQSANCESVSDPDELPKSSSRTETGFLMKFGPESHIDLSPFDVAANADYSAYPLPKSALESLPTRIEARLRRDNSVQFYGEYDREQQKFVHASLSPINQSSLELIAEFIEQDASPHNALDYVIVEEAELFEIDQWATIRDVTENAVERNIAEAKEVR